MLSKGHEGQCMDHMGNKVIFERERDLCMHPVGNTYCSMAKGHGGTHVHALKGGRAEQEEALPPLGARKQGPPVDRGAPDVTGLVVKDLEARAKLGEAKYGTRLRPFNSRDAFLDFYQELLDAVEYARQKLYEDYNE